MAGKGPAPTKFAADKRRPNATPGYRQLPYEGRTGDSPEFPFDEGTKRELALWDKLWHLPQAVMWEHMHAEDTVAMYVRALVVVENDITNDKMLNQVRQLDSKLGLSPRALQDLRWEIEQAPVEVDDTSNGSSAGRVFIPNE